MPKGSFKPDEIGTHLLFERIFKKALKTDVDDLFEAFSKGPCNYEHFRVCFKAVDFWTIFFGRITVADHVEYADDFFQYAVSYMFPREMRPKSGRVKSFNPKNAADIVDIDKTEQIFGIYLCYMTFFMQPDTRVRLIKAHIDCIKLIPEIMKELSTKRLIQPLYCLHRLITAKAFSIHPFDEDHNPLLQRRFGNTESDSREVEVNEFERLNRVVQAPAISYLGELQDKYDSLKKQLNLPYSGANIVTTVKEIANETKQQYHHQKTANSQPKPMSMLEKLSAKRRKALESDIRVSRHRRHHFGGGMEFSDDESGQQADKPTSSTAATKMRSKKIPKTVDPVQAKVKQQIGHAKAKSNRIRRETLGDSDEVSSHDIAVSEVLSDVAQAARKISKLKKKPTQFEIPTPNAVDPPRRRSARLASATAPITIVPVPVESSHLCQDALNVLSTEDDANSSVLDDLRKSLTHPKQERKGS